MAEHENDHYAHAPILLNLRAEITELQKLGWMIRGGLITAGVLITGGLLTVILHTAGVL